jgi:hypothetical protein
MSGPNSLLFPGNSLCRGDSVADFDKLFAVNVRADLLGQLKQLTNVSYGVAYQNLLIAAVALCARWSSAATSSPRRDPTGRRRGEAEGGQAD